MILQFDNCSIGVNREKLSFRRSRPRDDSGNYLVGNSLVRRAREAIVDDVAVVDAVRNLFKRANEMFQQELDYNNIEVRYMIYTADDVGYFDWHNDVYDNPTRTNVLSLSLCYADQYEGGELCFEIGNYRLQKEQCVVFLSSLEHCVTPVTKGTREVLVAWIRK